MHDIMLKANQLLSLVLSTGATRSNGRKGIIPMGIISKLASKGAKKLTKRKPLKRKGNEKLLSKQTGAGRGKFERGNPPAPKPVEGMAKGTMGGSAKSEAAVDAGLMGKVTMTADANFIEALATRKTKAAAKNRVAIQNLAKEGNKKAKALVAKIEKAESAAVDKKGRATSQSLRDRKIYDKGEYINRETGEVIKNPRRASDFPDGGPKVYDFNPTAKRMEAIKNSVKAKEMTKRERELEGMKAKQIKSKIKLAKTPGKSTNVVGKGGGRFSKGGMPTTYKGGVLNGHGKDYGKPGGYNMGGLATPTAKQTGLKKLPSSVRNKMGYMYGGGMAKKNMGSMDYRKGGLVIMIGTGKPMKNKKG